MGDDRDGRDDSELIEAPLAPRLALAWRAEEPPARFTDAVLRARAGALAGAAEAGARATQDSWRGLRGRWKFGIVLGVLALVAGSLVAASLWRGGHGHEAQGAGFAVGRETFRLGDRALAVAEDGAALRWRIDGNGAARVEQLAGEVFYRVERGGAFTVITPVGEAQALGTCFRVEVRSMKPSVAGLTGAVAGAALGALAVVGVYEGRVLASTDRGRLVLGPGERAELQKGGPPRKLGGVPAVAAPASMPAPPAANASREELLSRDHAQRQEIAALRGRVAELEQASRGAALGRDRGFFDATRDELLAMAKRCEVRFDAPPVFGIEAPRVDDRLAAALGLSGPEREAMAGVLQDMHSQFAAEVRRLYVGVTGDSKGAESLAPDAMGREIEDKSPKGSADAARRRLSLERAGLAAPPQSQDGMSPAERYLRLVASLGDQLEQRLGEKIGPARAHDLRAARNGWPNKLAMSGCGGEAEE